MKYLTGCLLLLCSFFAKAQKPFVLELNDNFRQERILLPFNEIIVKDARFDQTKIGYVNNRNFLDMVKLKKRKAVLPDSLHLYLPQMIKTFSELNDSSHSSLLILVKKFRVAENFISSVKDNFNNNLTLNLSVSFYKVDGTQCSRLFGIDDILLENIDIDSDKKINFLDYLGTQRSILVTNMLYQLFKYRNWQKQPTGSLVPLSQMNEAIEKRFALPVYQQQPASGLYKTFSDFKNATPAVTNISVQYHKGKIEKVLDGDGHAIDASDYWGLCDGKKNYLSFRNEFTELIPCGKSFEVLSYRTVAEVSGRSVMGDGRYSGFLGSFSGGNKIDEYFDLNMDDGNLFLEEVFGKSTLRNLINEK
jgi:hypothetical protein